MNRIKSKYFIKLFLFLLSSIILFQCTKDREPTAPTEIERPQIYGMIPREGELSVSLNINIQMIFNEPMDVSTFPGHFLLKDINNEIVNGEFSSMDSIVIFKPSKQLKKSNFYFAELRGRVRDINRNSIQVNNEPVFDDTTLLMSTWFYTEGDYSDGGYFNIYIRDKKEGRIIFLKNLDSVLYPITNLTSPDGIALSSDGNLLIISNTGKNEIVIAAANNGNILNRLTVAANPVSIVTYNDYAYIISINGKAISKINLNSYTLENTLPLNFYPAKLAISKNGETLYTFDQVTRDLVLINSNNGSIKKRIRNIVTNIVSGELRVDYDTGNLFICDTKGRKIKVTDPDGNNVQEFLTFSTGVEPIDIIFWKDFAFVVAGNSVYKYNKFNSSLVNKISFDTGVKSLCVVPTGELIYITLATKVAILDNDTFRPLKTIDLVSTGINTVLSNIKKF